MSLLRVIRRLLTVTIWSVGIFFAVGFFVVAPDADGFEHADWIVRIIAIGILLFAYSLNKITNWIFAD
jgi:hypothetical protein